MPQPARSTSRAYSIARQRYADLGVDADAALRRLRRIPLSLHCWQGDDVRGFENRAEGLGGGLAATGNYPGKARTPGELRADLECALAAIPGRHRLNLHASYGEFSGKPADRNAITPAHFAGWISWAKRRRLGLDFNPTFFSHPKAADGFTLSHRDPSIRRFWIEHGRRCREIGVAFGKALGSPCVTNIWIPDGYKDTPVDRRGPRERLVESLDAIFRQRLNPKHNIDAVEGKLFGIGCESYTVGSHEFYLGYAVSRKKVLCLDAGHFHPTESVADKLSAVFCHLDRVLLHVSRGVRWDSDHVVILNDDLEALALELVRGGYLDRTHIGLDYFDASINRVAAWIIGARNTLKALLLALLEPIGRLRELEAGGDHTARLALLEECRALPFGAVWDHYCEQQGVSPDHRWLNEIRRYERDVLARRQ